MRVLLCCLITLGMELSGNQLLSQAAKELTLSGVVQDAETKEPLPFAHVIVGEVVTITNLDGEFVLSSAEYTNHPLQVSFIGYESFTDSSVFDGKKFNILLQPVHNELEAVVVRTGDWVMDRVFRRMHINYAMTHQSILGYYKEKVSDDSSMFYLAEGILDIYLPSNVSGNDVQISPIKSRKQVFRPVSQHNFTKIRGHASDMVESSIWRENSFLHQKNRENYDFAYAGKTSFRNKDVFVVNFEGLNKKGNTSGTLFIEDESFAIIKMQYRPNTDRNNFWNEVVWVEEFTESDGLWNLYRVTYDGNWFENNKQYHYSSLLVINHATPIEARPAMGVIIEKKDIFFHEAEDFSESFWESYNFVKLNHTESIQ